MDKIIKLLRNETLLNSYDVAIETLKTKLNSKTDGEIAIVTYGENWQNAQTLIGVVRVNGNVKSSTIYAPFKNSDIQIGKGLELAEDGKLVVKLNDQSESYLAVDENGIKLSGVNDAITNTVKSLSIEKITDGLEANVKEAFKLELTEGDKKTVLGETINIYKDKSLKSAEFVTEDSEGKKGQFLKLVYNTDEGKESTVYINMSQLLAETEFKDGLQVSASGEVSVKVSNNDESKKYLTVDQDGVKVSGIDNAIDKILKDYEKTTYADPFEGKISDNSLHVSSTDTVANATKKLEGTISKLVDEVIANEETVAKSISDIANATGVVDDNGKITYISPTNSNYINSATSVYDATIILDEKIKDVSDIASDTIIDGGTY